MKKILLVEEEKLLAGLLHKKLSDKGYYVFLSEDGEQGLQQMKENPPDLVLMDVALPRLGGLEVLKAMGQDSLLKDIPVIIISNSGQPAEIDKAKALGAKDWLVKTEFDPEQAVGKVRKHIGEADETKNNNTPDGLL